jgi:hypothetical protein
LSLNGTKAGLDLAKGWRIDWNAAAKKTTAPAKGDAADWQRSFVLNLGKGARANPNADLRFWL